VWAGQQAPALTRGAPPLRLRRLGGPGLAGAAGEVFEGIVVVLTALSTMSGKTTLSANIPSRTTSLTP
jgi:hypothetical protein